MAVAQEKNIVVTSGADRAIPIAVVPFGWQGGTVLPEDMAEIVGNDLRNSGIFQPIPRQNMISMPTRGSEIIYRDWKALGAQYVMVGNIEPAGGTAGDDWNRWWFPGSVARHGAPCGGSVLREAHRHQGRVFHASAVCDG